MIRTCSFEFPQSYSEQSVAAEGGAQAVCVFARKDVVRPSIDLDPVRKRMCRYDSLKRFESISLNAFGTLMRFLHCRMLLLHFRVYLTGLHASNFEAHSRLDTFSTAFCFPYELVRRSEFSFAVNYSSAGDRLCCLTLIFRQGEKPSTSCTDVYIVHTQEYLEPILISYTV